MFHACSSHEARETTQVCRGTPFHSSLDSEELWRSRPTWRMIAEWLLIRGTADSRSKIRLWRIQVLAEEPYEKRGISPAAGLTADPESESFRGFFVSRRRQRTSRLPASYPAFSGLEESDRGAKATVGVAPARRKSPPKLSDSMPAEASAQAGLLNKPLWVNNTPPPKRL